jgi:hypothetical protein
MRGVRSLTYCGVAKLGVDGTARHSRSVTQGMVDRTTANSFAAGCYGSLQVDQAVKTKPPRREPLAGYASEPGVNASPLIKEPAA